MSRWKHTLTRDGRVCGAEDATLYTENKRVNYRFDGPRRRSRPTAKHPRQVSSPPPPRGGVGRRVISGDVGDEVRARPPHRGSPRAEVGLALRLGENGRRRVCRRRGVIRPGRDSDVMSGDRGPRVTVAVESDDVGAGCSCPASHSLPAVGGVGAGALDGGSR